MRRERFRRSRMRGWAALGGLVAAALPVAAQETAGLPRYSFDIAQRFGASDNIRLSAPSAGTTLYSDTTFTFGFNSTTRTQTFSLLLSGVGRVVDDPVLGSDSGLRDPRIDLSYAREGANSRMSLFANYARPDLAFLDPLQQAEIDDQDLYNGAGTREDFAAGFRLETGLHDPLGFEFDINSRRRSYSNVTDPLLFSNQTDRASLAAVLRFSRLTEGRLKYSAEHYWAEDVTRTDRDTRRLTFNLSHALSETTSLDVDMGYSEVVETFDALPGVENVTRGPVGAVRLTRQRPNGWVDASLDTTLSDVGRQTTLEFGRLFRLPASTLEIGIGATRGQSFDARPVGLVSYSADLPRGSFSAGLSRTVSISDTLSQATETTRADLGYSVPITDLSALSFNLYYADISLVGNAVGRGARQRGSFYATYSHNLTEDWDLQVGYEFRYYNPDIGSAARSNTVFFGLARSQSFLR